MSDRSFLDTNILLYTDDADAPGKQARALALIAQLRRGGYGVISTQVMQEYFSAATRKLGLDSEMAKRKVELFARMDVAQIGRDDVLAAIDVHRLHKVAFWDALIVHTAGSAGCTVLYTEDLSHGQVLAGVRIVNPFFSE